MLEEEKAANDRRAQAGVEAVLPIAAVSHLVMGTYETNAKIATGEWAAHIDRKIVELHRIKSDCVFQAQRNAY